MEGSKDLTIKRHKGIFRDDRNILYLDCAGGQKSLKLYTYKGVFSLYINYTQVKIILKEREKDNLMLCPFQE